MNTQRVGLGNGGRLLLRHSAEANSVTLGIFTLSGLHQEPENCSGMAHFLEHMSFKGTEKRSARKITESIDYLGAQINAHTTKEYTCYYVTVLSHSLDKAMDILFDLFVNSVLKSKDIEMEKQVVLEEIHMYEDTPDEHIHDVFSSTILGGHRLARPILGSVDSLAAINQDNLAAFKQHYFNPKNLLVSVSGNIPNQDKLIKKVNNYCSFGLKTPAFETFNSVPTIQSKVTFMRRDIEQIHFCLGMKGVPFDHKDHYKVTMLSTILGGSMSSRLFQKIREKRGWAYSVYAYASFYKYAGLFTVYAGINKSKFIPTLRIIMKEFNQMATKTISARELRKVKEQLKGNLILSLEKSSSWMNWMGRSSIYFDRILTVDDIIESIESVSLQDIQLLSQELFQSDQMALTAIGPLPEKILNYNQEPLVNFLAESKLDVFNG